MSLPRPALPAARRMPVRTLGALSASVIAFPLGAAAAHAGSVPVPQPTRALPSALDVAPPYQAGTRCLTENQPGPVAFARLLEKTYGTHAYGILRACDQEHGEGRALDWMLDARKPDQLEVGNTLTRWLSAKDDQGRQGAMARRFGINYMIWNKRIWKAWAPERGWAAYSGSSPHTDHIHISFTWDGAYALNSWWTGRARTTYLTGPATTGGTDSLEKYASTVLRRGSRGAAVQVFQRAVGGLAVDGSFGPATEARVKAYQGEKGLARTGVVDAAVWTALIASGGSSGSGSTGTGSGSSGKASSATHPLAKYAGTTLRLWSRGAAVKAMQQAVGGLVTDGSFGPRTRARVLAWQKSKGLPVDGVVDAKDWKVLMSGSAATSSGSGSSTSSGSSSAQPTLRLGSKGAAVRTFQKAAGGLVVDGSFGPRTQARVRSIQSGAGLSVTGVVDARTWSVVLAKSAPLAQYYDTVLRRGSRGSAVKALQQALRITVDGSFGPQTQAAVKAAQKRAKIAQTGVVARVTWKAIAAQA